MLKTILAAMSIALITGAGNAWAEEQDAYFKSLENDRSKLAQEYEFYVAKYPVQTGYYAAHVLSSQCGFAEPSGMLYAAIRRTQFIKTRDGQRISIVTGLIANLVASNNIEKAKYCQSAKTLLDASEAYVATHP